MLDQTDIRKPSTRLPAVPAYLWKADIMVRMEPAFDVGRFIEALRRVTESRAVLEKRLAEIRDVEAQMQHTLEDLERLGRYAELRDDTVPTSPYVDTGEPPTTRAATFTDAVITVFEQRPDETFAVDDVLQILQQSRPGATTARVRNAINYLAKEGGKLRRPQRGKYTLRNPSTPVAPGVEDHEESIDGSSREIGDRDNGSVTLHDQGGDAHSAPYHLDHAGDRASIIGG